MATGGGEVNSDETINIKCCFCVKNNRTREAVKYCVECKEYYCSPCTDTHQMFSSMKGHKLLDKANLRSLGSDGDLLSVPTQRCSQHQSEVTNMYCKDHDQVACPPCIALNHRTCKDILFIPEQVDNLYNRTELTDMKQKLHKSKTTMQEIKAAYQNKIKELKSMFDKEIQSVKAFRQELQAQLDNLEQETIKELKREFDRIETQLTSEIQLADNLIDAINEVSTELKKSEGNKSQEFVSVKFCEQVTTKAHDVQKDQQKKTEETFNFLADQNIKAFLQQIQTVGKVSINKTSNFIVSQKEQLYKVKHQRKINVNIPSDHQRLCSIRGSCTTAEGSLLLADFLNDKLKRLDTLTETVNDYLDFQSGPTAVCLTSNTHAAVTLDNKTLQFVSLENKLTATRNLTMNHSCYGLAHKDGKLFISDNQQTVYIHDMNGKELKRISTDASGKEIFGQTAHITISNEGDKVFVADGEKGIVILDSQGNYISTLTDPSLTKTWGVGTDGNNLFVLGNKSNNIVQFSKDYTLSGEVIKVRDPYSLYFDPHKTRMYITLCNNDGITMLELE